MGFLSPPKIPAPITPPPAAAPPTMADPSIAQAGSAQSNAARAAAGMGFSDTIKNQGGIAGVSPAANQKAVKSLLS
jgi:hypothetical protein